MTRGPRTTRRGFTLVELLVVICLIGMLAILAMPSLAKLVAAGADSQAYNMLSAQSAAARSRAIRTGNYVILHVQMAPSNIANTSARGKCYMAVLERSRTDPSKFILSDEFTPMQVPGTVAFGQLSDSFVTGNSYKNLGGDAVNDAPGNNAAGFTNFSIIFSPSGTVVRAVDGQGVSFDGNSALFKGGDPGQLWAAPGAQFGVTAVTLFDYIKFNAGSDAARAAYLKSNSQFLAINVYTGQLFARQ